MAGRLSAWRQRYESLGLATIPLYASSKRPVCAEWQSTPPVVQWREAGIRAGNIGVRTGNGFAVADADSAQTAATLAAWLAGRGMKAPMVITPSGGRHYWLRVNDVPGDAAFCLWRGDVGPGELRVGPGAQVVAPCSMVDGKRYRFRDGTPEDWLRLRPLRWSELAELVTPQRATPLDALPIPLPRRDLADWAEWLLDALAHRPPGVPVRVGRNGTVVQYDSRSDAEQAVILHAVGRGWDFEDVAALFEQRQPAHYMAQRDPAAYLRLCWRNALAWYAGTAARQTIADLWRWAESRPWPGRGGGNDQAAYRVLLQRGWLADTLTPDVSRRDIEEYASMGNQGARAALERLTAQGLIARAGRRRWAGAAQTWRLLPDVLPADNGYQSADVRQLDGLPGGAELWAMLGRAAGMVYARLSGEPLTVAALAAATGKHRSTVYRAADALARYGLAVVTDAGLVAGERSVNDVARELGADAAKRSRERRIATEREMWQEWQVWR